MRKQIKKSAKINVDKLREQETVTPYKIELSRKLNDNNISENTQSEHPNDAWNRIAKSCKETANKETNNYQLSRKN